LSHILSIHTNTSSIAKAKNLLLSAAVVFFALLITAFGPQRNLHNATTLQTSPHPSTMTVPADLKSLYPLPKIYRSGVVTVEAPGYERVEGETIPRRNAKCKDKLLTQPHPDIHTIYDILKYSSKNYGNAKALGSRKLVKTHNEVKKVKKVVDGKETEVDKKWTYFELSSYTYKSFVEFETLCLQIGAGLRKLGMVAHDRVHLFAGTQ
jgi:long-chain acyl-CoA synthetase